jgi:hypothetical protein
MGAVIPLFKANTYIDESKYGEINGIKVPLPRSSHDFLKMCKGFLTEEDYTDVCICILDDEAYDVAEEHITKLVDCYYTFKP